MRKTIIIMLAVLISAAFVNAQHSNFPAPLESFGNQHPGDVVSPASNPLGATMVHSWDYNGGAQQYGMFDAATPGADVIITPYTGSDVGNAGEMVLGDPTKFYSIDMLGGAWLIDISAGTETSTGSVSGWTGSYILGMALDYGTGIYYICDDNDDLYTIDMNTLVATLVGNFATSSGYMIGITFDGGGNLWGHDLSYNAIFSINKTTGVATIIGTTGFSANFAQGMGYDPSTNMVVLTAYNSGTGQAEYRSVNTATGATTFLGKIGAPGALTEYGACCIQGQPLPIPVSNWAIILGVLLIGTFIVVRYRRTLA